MTQEIQQAGGFSLSPNSLQEAMDLANIMSQSEMVPKDYRGNPGNILVAVQMGQELGLKPVQSLQNIAVVNGRPSVWGDGLRAIVMSAPDLCDLRDDFDESTMTARCTITRIKNGNKIEFVGEFSQADAQAAGLWGRNTWKSYPKKMLEWRAFGFAARKAYADRLKGIQLAEEAQDIPVKQEAKDMGPAKVEPASITNEQVQAIFDALEMADMDPAEFCKVSKIQSIEKLQPNRYEQAMDWLKSKAITGGEG